MRYMSKYHTNLGDVFERLTVIEVVRIPRPKENSSRAGAICQCTCGVITKPITLPNLHTGRIKSCGCLQKEGVTKRMTTHGRTRTNDLTYSSWKNLMNRTRNINHPDYIYYKERGVGLDEPEWGLFDNFLRDMGDRPSKEHSLDRIDNSRGYSKDNCRWATSAEQSRNKSTNVWLTLPDGSQMILADVARKYGIPKTTLKMKLANGESLESIIQKFV